MPEILLPIAEQSVCSLILPGDPLFNFTLATSRPPNPDRPTSTRVDGIGFVAEAGSGVLRAANHEDIQDYLLGGEAEQRLEEIEDAES